MVSRMTIYRRRIEHQVTEVQVSDAGLTSSVRQIVQQHPSVGQSFVWGVLRSQGYVVTRERVRRKMRQCDPLNTALRLVGMHCNSKAAILCSWP